MQDAASTRLRYLHAMLDLSLLHELFGTYGTTGAMPQVAKFTIGNRVFDPANDGPRLMGVVNLSADSWYRESVVLNADAAIERGKVLAAQGAALVDIGAESSLAHAARVDEVVQKSALLPVVSALAEAGVMVSVETYRATVTEACLKAGARVLNMTGTTDRTRIYEQVAAFEAGLILCFVQGANVREVSDLELGRDPIGALYEYFAREVEAATQAGVTRLWIDPGLGFYYRNLQDSGERIRHQMRVFLNSFRLAKLGWPICQALPHAFECFEDEVRAAEPYFAVLAALGGNHLLRTHELVKVRGVVRALRLVRDKSDLLVP